MHRTQHRNTADFERKTEENLETKLERSDPCKKEKQNKEYQGL